MKKLAQNIQTILKQIFYICLAIVILFIGQEDIYAHTKKKKSKAIETISKSKTIRSQTHIKKTTESDLKKSIVQVKITSQAPYYLYPWQYKRPTTVGAVGVVVSQSHILVFSSAVEHSTFIEVKKHSSYTPIKAVLVKIDYESNLSLLKVVDKNFFEDLTPIKFSSRMDLEAPVEILQLDNSGALQLARGRSNGLDMDTYPTGYTELPYIYLNTNEKLEGNGEVIVQNKIPVGLLFEFNDAKNMGKFVPGFVVNKFLSQSIEKKTTAFPHTGFFYRPLVDRTTRSYLGLKKKQQGVLVTEVIPYSSADGVLEVNDVIVEFGGQKIDSRGYYKHSVYEKQSILFMAHCGDDYGYVLGKELPLKVIRNKKLKDLKLTLKPFPLKALRIPYKHLNGEKPKYLIRGGYMFIELSEYFLREWGDKWRSRIDKKLLYIYDFHKFHKRGETGKIVVMTQVLPDDFNEGFHQLGMTIVRTINDKPLQSIVDLENEITKSKDQFVKIGLDGEIDIVLNKSKLNDVDKSIQKKYKIKELKNF